MARVVALRALIELEADETERLRHLSDAAYEALRGAGRLQARLKRGQATVSLKPWPVPVCQDRGLVTRGPQASLVAAVEGGPWTTCGAVHGETF